MLEGTSKTRLVIIDDHPIVREGLKAFLELQDFEVVGEAGDAVSGLERVSETQPELVLLDVQLPGENGLRLLPKLLNLESPPKVLMLTSFLEEDYLREALRLGASGFLVKHSGPDRLADALRAALRGELPLDPEATRMLAQPFDDPLEELTRREREVLEHLAEGVSNKRIATALDIAEKTVKVHVSSILAKLGVKDRVQAALYARGRRL